MTKRMRYFVAVLCLLSLVLAGPVSAACAANPEACPDAPTTAQAGAPDHADCDMGQTSDTGQNKLHKCSHDACCGYQLAQISEAGDFLAPPQLHSVVAASAPTHLTGVGWETLLDPPRS